MSTIKMSILAAAVVIGIPTASALAAQQLGRESVTVEPERPLRGTPVTVEIKRSGRDSVFITRDSVISHPNPTKFTDVSFKPGRA